MTERCRSPLSPVQLKVRLFLATPKTLGIFWKPSRGKIVDGKMKQGSWDTFDHLWANFPYDRDIVAKDLMIPVIKGGWLKVTPDCDHTLSAGSFQQGCNR